MNQQTLKDNLHYNQTTGIFTWLKTKSRSIKIGDIAGTVNKSYIRIIINGNAYQAHRLAWLDVYGEIPSNDIDHINHDKSDNRINNLRCVTKRENQQNRTININNVSGFTGVSWNKCAKKWQARIKIASKYKHLGLFTNLDDAIAARKAANLEYNFHINHGC